MTYQHCNGKHDLRDISSRRDGTPGVVRLTRWCCNCGAIVIDVDVDGRTDPGAGMPMRFPRIAQAHVHGVDSPDGSGKA